MLVLWLLLSIYLAFSIHVPAIFDICGRYYVNSLGWDIFYRIVSNDSFYFFRYRKIPRCHSNPASHVDLEMMYVYHTDLW